jgi:DNA-binding transcriptional MerR regulator
VTAADRSGREALSIGAVLTRLRPDFPDVTISKIRFLETEGLVSPARTASGYRQFSSADVARLRFVLAAQRDHYLPLKVIKEQLDAAADGTPVPEGPRPPRALVPVDGLPTADQFASDPSPRLTRERLCSEAEVDDAKLTEMERHGLIRAGAAGFYDEDAVLIARTVRTMTEFGIEPRHLRAFRASADREVGLLEQIVTPAYRQRSPGARARGDEMARELAALSVTLHTLLVKTGLRDVTGQ